MHPDSKFLRTKIQNCGAQNTQRHMEQDYQKKKNNGPA